MFRKTLLIAISVVLAANVCSAKTTLRFSLIGQVGYFQPLGDWTTHRYAEGVEQFQGGYTITPEIELQINDVGLAAMYNYTRLNAGDWEEYVATQGEDLYASGSINQLGGLVRYYFVDTERHDLNLEGGLSYVWLKGTETYRGFTYNYDFMESGLGFLAGAGYHYAFNRRLSLMLPVRFLWKPEGIKYPEGETYDIFGLFFQPGLKLTF
jgi:hypothetical protein